MKRLIIILIILLLISTISYADIFEPGVSNETQYKEIIFLSGVPVEFTGRLEIKQSGRGDQVKYTYDYNLTGPNGATLTRKVVYLVDEATDPDLKQISTGLTLDPKAKVSERITIGDKTYVLEEQILNKTSITQDKSIIKYTSGTWNGRKTYSEGENKVIVDIYGENYKYDNTWSTVETAMIRHVITYQNAIGTSGNIQVNNGTVEYGVTNIREKEIISQQSLPNQISFKESYMISEKEENTVVYKYDMPITVNSKTTRRKTGEGSFKLTTMPKLTSLPIPQYQDIRGYWAEKDINRLFSLGVMDGESKYFNPRIPINRAEFAKAIVKACGLEVETEVQRPRSRKEVQEDIIFSDVDPNHPYYPYIKRVTELDLMNGTGYNTFGPDENLTKAQAVTILIRALGLEDITTFNLGRTFADEAQIPDWARKSIYVAEDLDIIDAEDNAIKPNVPLSRGEAANLINRFITYLQKEIKTDYRERVVNFN
ncbi:S-layer homology domain-containing protein, partial [Lutispora sp.]|uniref:S-layer homology domain-containing protein n=1 Tax=Lutispora sp. TaxID=2828727 RepID=UPI003565F490